MKISKALEIIEENSCRISEMEEWMNEFVEEMSENMGLVSTLNWNIKEALEIISGKELGKESNYENNEELLKDSPYLQALVTYFKESDTDINAKLKECERLEEFFSNFDI